MTRRQGPRTLARDGVDPLWLQLHDDLVRRLEGGEFPEVFPGELELVQQYSVSRHTVREALRRLRHEGVISSSRGRSSVVRPGMISQSVGAMYSLFHELESRGIHQRSELLTADRRQDEPAASRLGLEPDSELVYIERLRLGNDEPIAWDRSWLPIDLAAPLLDADLSHSALYDVWAKSAGVRLTGGYETIRAVSPTAQQRELLAMGEGEAALDIDRVGCLQDRPVELRRTVVRGSRFSFTAEWGAGQAYQMGVSGRR